MRTLPLLLPFVLFTAFSALADQPMCGTSEELEQRLRLYHDRPHRGPVALAEPSAPTLRDGAFYMTADEEIAGDANLFDLEGTSLTFTPRGSTNTFTTRRGSLRYEPPGAMLRDFAKSTGTGWHYATYDLTSFSLPLFGRNVTRLYLTAFNEIELDPPGEEGAMTFDNLQAAVHRNAVISPLMITTRKPPRQLAYPQVFVHETESSLFVTWRSTEGPTFGYDVQAELRTDGTIVFSYNSMRNMQWGTPLISAGFDPAATTRRTLYESTTGLGVAPLFGNLSSMLDIRSVDVSRIAESDLLAVRIRFVGPIDASKLADDVTLRYQLTVGRNPGATTYIDLKKTGWTILPLNQNIALASNAAARVDGDTLEFYMLQPSVDPAKLAMRVLTLQRPARTADTFAFEAQVDAAPRSTGADFSALANAAELHTPITEAFLLPVFDPYEVWARVQAPFAINKTNIDAVAIYQTFYTDMIFYAGAYSVIGNAGVTGIGLSSSNFGPHVPRGPNLLHMNHYTYGYSAGTETASQVLLHEFGHRWLYFFRFLDDGAVSNALNPVSAHPAAYVNTPSAFPVFGQFESSVMGGAFFLEDGNGTYRTHVANRGFSWVDLYLMGLAAPEEVEPWYYLAGTNLRAEYWPEHNIVVTGEKREVRLDQVMAVHGVRKPGPETSQKKFRVLFVLVTEPGKEATDADVARINELRALMERTFHLATGGRAIVDTEFAVPAKKRAIR